MVGVGRFRSPCRGLGEPRSRLRPERFPAASGPVRFALSRFPRVYSLRQLVSWGAFFGFGVIKKVFEACLVVLGDKAEKHLA